MFFLSQFLSLNFLYCTQGLRLCKESNGSITATRLGKNDVVVKGYQDPANHCLSADVIKCEGLLPKDQPVKVLIPVQAFIFNSDAMN